MEDSKKTIETYTYSLCDNDKIGKSVWVALISYKNTERLLTGISHCASKNRAELYSIYSALKVLKEPCKVHVYSDSQFVTNAFNLKWIERWQDKGWKMRHHDSFPNLDVWKALLPLLDYHDVSIEWINMPESLPKALICKKKAEQLFSYGA